MSHNILVAGGITVLCIGSDGHPLRREGDVGAFIGDAWAARAGMIALPVYLVSDEFFDLRTGILGAVAQKFVNYKLRLAIVGDVSKWERKSNAFRDFVREANRGKDMWFVETIEALEKRLNG